VAPVAGAQAAGRAAAALKIRRGARGSGAWPVGEDAEAGRMAGGGGEDGRGRGWSGAGRGEAVEHRPRVHRAGSGNLLPIVEAARPDTGGAVTGAG
jgi:hypothetical protein